MSTPLSPLLIVEDDTVFARVLAKSLGNHGLEVHTSSNSKGALALARKLAFAAAVLDLKLAGETSLALIPQLKALNPDMRILMLTGYASIQTAVEATKLGATNYLPKPAGVAETPSPPCKATRPTPDLPVTEHAAIRRPTGIGNTSSACSPNTTATSPPPRGR